MFVKAWLEQLRDLFNLLVKANNDICERRDSLMINAERLFDEIDQHNQGSVNVVAFSDWVAKNCGFRIRDEDLPAMDFLDGQSDYKIARDGFIRAVSS